MREEGLVPRPRAYPPRERTRFAERLQEWMWAQRPPLTTGQLAYKLGASQQTVWSWLDRGSIPHPQMLQRIADVTGIPLVEWYELAGYPVPRLRLPPQRETNAAYWDWWAETTTEIVRRGMRKEGIDERTIERALQEIVADIRREQQGKDYVPYIEREFATPPPERVVEAEQHVAERPADYTEQPTQTLERIKPERQERRASRRRDTAKPKTKP